MDTFRNSGWVILYEDNDGNHGTLEMSGTVNEEEQIKRMFMFQHPDLSIVGMQHPQKTDLPSDVYVG